MRGREGRREDNEKQEWEWRRKEEKEERRGWGREKREGKSEVAAMKEGGGRGNDGGGENW